MGKYNIALQTWWITGNKEKCLELLIKSERLTEATFFGVNYSADKEKVNESIKLWKQKLEFKNKTKVSERLIDNFEGLSVTETTAPAPAPEPVDSLIDLEDTGDKNEEVDAIVDTSEKEVEEEATADDVETNDEEVEEDA